MAIGGIIKGIKASRKANKALKERRARAVTKAVNQNRSRKAAEKQAKTIIPKSKGANPKLTLPDDKLTPRPKSAGAQTKERVRRSKIKVNRAQLRRDLLKGNSTDRLKARKKRTN